VGHDTGLVGTVERDAMQRLVHRTAEIYWRRLRDFANDNHLLHPINAETVLIETRRLLWLDSLAESLSRDVLPPQAAAIAHRHGLLRSLENAARQVYDARTLQDVADWNRLRLEQLLIRENVQLPEVQAPPASEPAP
jgi:hypothetical protein